MERKREEEKEEDTGNQEDRRWMKKRDRLKSRQSFSTFQESRRIEGREQTKLKRKIEKCTEGEG